jgi:ABC-type dipeptide/oligopeptide/nickel transport system permease subunit
MLHDASTNIRVFADFPWLLSPAAAMFLVVLGVNLALQDAGTVVFAESGEPRRGVKSGS